MRTKNFVVLLLFVFVVSLMLIVFGSQRSDSFQSIVTTTHQHIRNLQDTLRDAEEKNLVADEKHLKLLGFVGQNVRKYPNDTWHNTSLPVIVTYVFNGEEMQAIGLINSFSRILPNNTILIYDLGLNVQSHASLSNYCNSSRCQIIRYDMGDFPSHIYERNLHVYRPVIIQHALHNTGYVFYVDNDQRPTRKLTSTLFNNISRLALAKGAGVLAWPIRKAVSSLTHKKMFEYFHTRADNFLFLQMVDAKRLLVVNTEQVRVGVMLPWIQCSLTSDCVHPIGAQSAGCKFDKKPQYRYSGCHNYDVSALNIALGLNFRLDSTKYTYEGRLGLFTRVTGDAAAQEFAELERNATSEGRVTPVDVH